MHLGVPRPAFQMSTARCQGPLQHNTHFLSHAIAQCQNLIAPAAGLQQYMMLQKAAEQEGWPL